MTDETTHIAAAAASILRIGELVEIQPDGTITYGPNYSPDEAAKMLWEAIAQMGFRFVTASTPQPATYPDEPYAALSQHLHGDGETPPQAATACATPGCTNRPAVRLDDRRLCGACYTAHDFGDNA